MTLQQILNWTTVGGAIVAVVIVGAAWARARAEIRVGPRAVSIPRLPVTRRGMAVPDRTLVLTEPDNVGLRIIEPRGPAPAGADTAIVSDIGGDGPGHANGDAETATGEPGTTDAATMQQPAPGREITLTDQVTAGPAWTPSDSWLTSTTAVGAGVLAAVALGVGGSAAGSLLGVYALSAAVAPLVYACLGPSSPHSAAVTGSVRGYLLAALATLFGGIGMVGTIWGLGASAITAVAAEVVLGLGCLLIIAAIGAYGFRTIVGVLVTQTTTATGEPVRPAEPGLAPRTSSLLVGNQGRRSATL
jgi:hypothetical protein